jgi:hypothetical protein
LAGGYVCSWTEDIKSFNGFPCSSRCFNWFPAALKAITPPCFKLRIPPAAARLRSWPSRGAATFYYYTASRVKVRACAFARPPIIRIFWWIDETSTCKPPTSFLRSESYIVPMKSSCQCPALRNQKMYQQQFQPHRPVRWNGKFSPISSLDPRSYHPDDAVQPSVLCTFCERIRFWMQENLSSWPRSFPEPSPPPQIFKHQPGARKLESLDQSGSDDDVLIAELPPPKPSPQIFKHQPSARELERSHQRGCHLCSLI